MSIHITKNGRKLQMRWRDPDGRHRSKSFDNDLDGKLAAQQLEIEIKRNKAVLKKQTQKTTGREIIESLAGKAPFSQEAQQVNLLPELEKLAAHLEWFKEAALFMAGQSDRQFALRFDLMHADQNELYILGRNLRHWKHIFVPTDIKKKMIAKVKKQRGES
ncbi:hypothetical protein A7E78_11630 [Syntrophotalea acetylenivorans]|uniref:Uncharacterized protein n=1 Tax=Syntrophotalea acetylenivorans TaxID=1842532 RepID=A0A1L3GRF5_9BACT|nr:hypothetical protein [Syntrophotalea acetylenivorans]APG28440.1 hypothetical protein A7E78_11630 [Syntrophotalea acetylenivorans]